MCLFSRDRKGKRYVYSFELSDIMRNVIRNIKRNFHPLYCRPSGRRRRPGRFGRFSLRFPSVLTSRHISALSVVSTLQSARRPFFHLSISNWIFLFFFHQLVLGDAEVSADPSAVRPFHADQRSVRRKGENARTRATLITTHFDPRICSHISLKKTVSSHCSKRIKLQPFRRRCGETVDQ